MIALSTINAAASKAQVRAETERTPYLVTYRDGLVHIVAAISYSAPKHGAIERVRYPDGYVHPSNTSRRLW